MYALENKADMLLGLDILLYRVVYSSIDSIELAADMHDILYVERPAFPFCFMSCIHL